MSTAKKGLKLYDNLDVANTQNDNDLIDVYQKWAGAYDDDNDNLLGTVSQPIAVNIFARYVKNKAAKIIDVGCGTGLVGAELEKIGFSNYSGIDLSEEMLTIAKRRNYCHLDVGSLNDALPFADNEYDAALCVGVFTHGHVGAERLIELIRIVKSGGIICFTVNEGVYSSSGFDEKIKELESNKLVEILEIQQNEYMKKKNVKGLYCVLSVV